MKATTMVAAICGIALAAPAAGAEGYVSPVTGRPFREGDGYTLEQLKARDARVMERTGGFVVREAAGPLAAFVDARERPTATVDEVARLYRLGTRLGCVALREPRGGADPLAFARSVMESRRPLLAVVVVDGGEGGLPALSVFPEERIGIVNADRLRGGDDPSAPEMRVAREVWRAMGFIGGIGFSAQDNDVMRPYYTIEELDANRHPYIQPMNMARMRAMWSRLGVRREERVPYRAACAQGWAPEPTNALQRAIWDEVRSGRERGPARALRIVP